MGSQKGKNPSLVISDETIELLPERALFWRAKKTLVVSDLHWGKGDTFRRSGIPIPDALLVADLNRLTYALASTGATRLLVLGDLIHGRFGLTELLDEHIVRWRSGFLGEFVTVRGNHDRSWKKVPGSWKVNWTDEFEEGPFLFTHEPHKPKTKFAWAGHLHPTFRLRTGHDSLRLPCFHVGKNLGILPAFSEFSRGVVMPKKKDERVFVIADDQVIEIDLATRPRKFF